MDYTEYNEWSDKCNYSPTEETIRLETAKIRAQWSRRVRLMRSRGITDQLSEEEFARMEKRKIREEITERERAAHDVYVVSERREIWDSFHGGHEIRADQPVWWEQIGNPEV